MGARAHRPIELTLGCAVAFVIAGIALLVVFGIVALGVAIGETPTEPGDVLGMMGKGFGMLFILNALLVTVPLAILGIAMGVAAARALRGHRRAWIATTVMLGIFTGLLGLFAVFGQLIFLTLLSLAGVVCLLAPASRAWFARRVEFQLVTDAERA